MTEWSECICVFMCGFLAACTWTPSGFSLFSEAGMTLESLEENSSVACVSLICSDEYVSMDVKHMAYCCFCTAHTLAFSLQIFLAMASVFLADCSHKLPVQQRLNLIQWFSEQVLDVLEFLINFQACVFVTLYNTLKTSCLWSRHKQKSKNPHSIFQFDLVNHFS